jgi:hypothetical protein
VRNWRLSIVINCFVKRSKNENWQVYKTPFHIRNY